MTEQYYKPVSFNNRTDRIESEKRADTWKKRIGTTVLGLALFTTGALEGPKLAKSVANYVNPPTEHVDSETFNIKTGETVINKAEEAVENMTKRDNIDPSKIRNDEIVYESQAAAFKSMQTHNQTSTKPGDSFNVELTKSGSNYHIDVEPRD